jgi:2-keto-4-pentenoate hydratase/2-oxohepta-3-ene-1,7-dioic acid hydratase in catechol pathway
MSAPPARPGKLVCVGRNYLEHARELGNNVPSQPLLFLKPPSSVIGSGETIELPPETGQPEYEGEIGVVVGARLRRADEAAAARAIRGVVAVNDVTARDLQKTDGQWTRAKGFDTFCPIGPEAPAPADLAELRVVTRVNGDERQRGTAREMAFAIPTLLAYISQVMTLEPGDVVATGTPAGVGRLSPGDVVEVEVGGPTGVLSVVRNPVTAAPVTAAPVADSPAA